MNISEPFIRRPVGTSLLAAGLFLLGVVAYRSLPVAAIPRVDFPVVSVQASLPGADPATVASSVAAPLEKRLGQIAGVTEMTSVSTLGGTSITLQFDLNRNVDRAARDVQAAINASTADEIVAQRLSQVEGVSQVFVGGSEKSAIRVQINPAALASSGLSLEEVRSLLGQVNVDSPKGSLDGEQHSYALASNDQLFDVGKYQSLVITQKNNVPIRLSSLGRVVESVENTRVAGWAGTKPAVLLIVFKQPGANVIQTVDRIRAALPLVTKWIPPSIKLFQLSDR